jgi:hypothetical protein
MWFTVARSVSRGIELLIVALGLAGCQPRREPPESAAASNSADFRRDSLRIARLAIAAVTRRPDTLVEYRVIEFRADSLGHVLSIVAQIRAGYSDRLEISGGGGLVRVWRGDTVSVLQWYR